MATPLKLVNLPWIYTRQELSRFLSQTLNAKVKHSKILYDKQTGLSRGVAIVKFASDRISKDLLMRGTLEVDGRTVFVVRDDERSRTKPPQSMQD